MKFTVVMTLYDRPVPVLVNTLNQLGKSDLTDTDILIVDDGSHIEYADFIEAYTKGKVPVRYEKVNTLEDMPKTYHIEGCNNPAYANNLALDFVDSEFVFWMSSDVMVQPATLSMAREMDLNNVAWMPAVVDLDSGAQYLGPQRLTPFGWFFATATENLRKVGWDEEYLKGIAFEDNDFMARLALEIGRFVIDTRCTAWHQSHPQHTYSDDLKGHDINRDYTQKKWGGIPWHDPDVFQSEVKELNRQLIIDAKPKESLVIP